MGNVTPTDATQGSAPSSLIVGIRERDPAAWQKFSLIFGPLIYGWCRRKGLQPADAADVVQDVFRTVLSAIATFRRDQAGDSFQGWLWTITQSRVADHFRQQGVTVQAQSSELEAAQSESPTSASTSDHNWRVALVQRVLLQLESQFQPTSWQAFWRMVVQGESAEKIAHDLKISSAAVRQAKYRVLQSLRAELADLDSPPSS